MRRRRQALRATPTRTRCSRPRVTSSVPRRSSPSSSNDKPTIDALNEAGLEVSAVGNHEFDAGYDDLVNRVMAPYDATTNPQGGANWEYIAANVKLQGRRLARPRRRLDQGPSDGVEVGFVGAVTEHLPVAGLARRHRRHRGDRHRRRGQRRRPTTLEGRRAPTSSSCWSTRARQHGLAAMRRRPDAPRSAGSSTASTPTSTRSSPATPTWRTTAPSRCPAWAGTVPVTSAPWSLPASTARTSTSSSSRSTRHRRGPGQDPGRPQPEGRQRRPGNYTADAGRPRRSSTPPSPRPTSSVLVRWARSVRPFNRAKFAGGTRRTAVASRPWATWSLRSSAGPRATRSPVRRRSRS